MCINLGWKVNFHIISSWMFQPFLLYDFDAYFIAHFLPLDLTFWSFEDSILSFLLPFISTPSQNILHSSALPEYKAASLKKPRFILSHYGAFKTCFDWLILIATFYVAIVVPFGASFRDNLNIEHIRTIYMDVFVEIIFIIGTKSYFFFLPSFQICILFPSWFSILQNNIPDKKNRTVNPFIYSWPFLLSLILVPGQILFYPFVQHMSTRKEKWSPIPSQLWCTTSRDGSSVISWQLFHSTSFTLRTFTPGYAITPFFKPLLPSTQSPLPQLIPMYVSL